jgi:hypothetical protein
MRACRYAQDHSREKLQFLGFAMRIKLDLKNFVSLVKKREKSSRELKSLILPSFLCATIRTDIKFH